MIKLNVFGKLRCESWTHLQPQCRSVFLIAIMFVPFVSYSRLQKMGGTWEEHGRNLGGTIRMCGRAFLRNGARLRFSRTKLLIFSHRQRFVLKVCCFCPEYWFFRDDTDYWMWRETNRMQRCFYVFEIWDNWDKLDKWGDNWDLR